MVLPAVNLKIEFEDIYDKDTYVEENHRDVTLKGYVIDSAGTFKNHLKKPIGIECAERCARAGWPLVIQAEDGSIPSAISGEMPADGQNDKLMK